MQYPTCTMIDKIFGFKNSFLFISVNTSCHEHFTKCHSFIEVQTVSNITKLLKYTVYQTLRFHV